MRSGIQGTKACGFIFKPMCYAVISRKKKKTDCFLIREVLFIYIIIVIYAFNLNYFVSFCGFYAFYVSF